MQGGKSKNCTVTQKEPPYLTRDYQLQLKFEVLKVVKVLGCSKCSFLINIVHSQTPDPCKVPKQSIPVLMTAVHRCTPVPWYPCP
jgi:hypothetical protein